MTLRSVLRLVGATLAAGLLSANAAFAAPSRPNILLIVSEDNGPELGCYGDPYARTPNLDHLAAQECASTVRLSPRRVAVSRGRVFSPGFIRINMGRSAWRHGASGCIAKIRRISRAVLRPPVIALALLENCTSIPSPRFPSTSPRFPKGNFARRNLGDYAKRAEGFITAGDQPFFLSVNYPDAHDPWLRQVDGLPKTPQTGRDVKAMAYFGIDPPEMREMVADYYNSMSRLDTLVGDLLAALQRSGKAENTIVVYLGDHGADMLRGKRTCYEGGLRIPLIVRWPGQTKPQVREELVSTVDLMPTFLAATGATPVSGLAGRALQPLFGDGAAEWRTHLFSEYHTHAAAANYHPQRAVRTDRFKLIENLLPDIINPGYADTDRKLEGDAIDRGQADFRGGLPKAIAAASPEVRAAYAVMEKPPRYELYDLQSDPHEFRNLAGLPEHNQTLADLAKHLSAWREQTQDPLLDPKNLQRLTAEVTALKGRAAGGRIAWGYPDYFFGKEPAATSVEAPTRKKKNP